MSKILIVGSINMDIVNSVKQFPLPGETIHSLGTAYFPGGKGANQAVAAARAGGDCVMIGAVGEDSFADTLIGSLRDNGIATEHVLRRSGTSGVAIITVNGDGENNIILSEGANGGMTAADVASAIPDWSEFDAVLLQNEIPWETTLSVIHSASSNGVRVLYNPAPAVKIADEVFPHIDTLVINETEAAVISGITISDEDSVYAAADWVLNKGASNVIITLGEKGCVHKNAHTDALTIPAFRVKPVDTTAAGDTFLGAYATASVEGKSTEEALQFAAAAAALAVTKAGAQTSIPSRDEIAAFLQK